MQQLKLTVSLLDPIWRMHTRYLQKHISCHYPTLHKLEYHPQRITLRPKSISKSLSIGTTNNTDKDKSLE